MPVNKVIINSKLHEIMNKGGWRKDSIWQFFYKLSVDGKTIAKYKNCENI